MQEPTEPRDTKSGGTAKRSGIVRWTTGERGGYVFGATMFIIVVSSMLADLVLLPIRIYATADGYRTERIADRVYHPRTDDYEGGPQPAYLDLTFDDLPGTFYCARTEPRIGDTVAVLYSRRIGHGIVTRRGAGLLEAIRDWDLQGPEAALVFMVIAPLSILGLLGRGLYLVMKMKRLLTSRWEAVFEEGRPEAFTYTSFAVDVLAALLLLALAATLVGILVFALLTVQVMARWSAGILFAVVAIAIAVPWPERSIAAAFRWRQSAAAAVSRNLLACALMIVALVRLLTFQGWHSDSGYHSMADLLHGVLAALLGA